jgi:predicted amidohydrolase YtcJ
LGFDFMKLPLKRLILINTNIITLDPIFPHASWVAIENDKIVATGNGEDWKNLKTENASIIDCHGKTVLPGFIDAHMHLFSYAKNFVNQDLGPDKNVLAISDIQSIIYNCSQKSLPGKWILARGYDEFYLEEKRHPNRWDLDEVAPDHPVKLTHRSGHAHVLNSLALKLVLISNETGDPPGGLIDRDINTGEPTGLLYEMGEFLSERIPPLDPQELLSGVKLANKRLVSLGITSVHDVSHSNDAERLKEIKSWKAQGLFKPRINLMLGPMHLDQLGTQDLASRIGENQLRLNGIKIILDETTGQLHPSQQELNNAVLKIHRAGFQVAIHAVEESAVESACAAIEYALGRFPRSNHRHRIEHCSVCTPPLLKRLASLGIVAVTQPPFIFYHGDRYLETVSDEQLPYLYPIGSLLKAGIPVAGSSDCPIVPPNPLLGMCAAVDRKSETGKTVGEGEKISPLDALCMYTINAAIASFEEDLKGSVTPGKLADLVVLNADPSMATPEEIREIEVEMTILNGEVVSGKQH